MFSTGSGMREPSATSLAFCLPLYLTAYIKFTLIFWWLGGAFRILLWLESYLALWHVVKTSCSLIQSISSQVASAHLVLLCSLSNSRASLYDLGMRFPNMYLFDLLTCLIFDCKRDCCITNKKCLIVTTINPI